MTQEQFFEDSLSRLRSTKNRQKKLLIICYMNLCDLRSFIIYLIDNFKLVPKKRK